MNTPATPSRFQTIRHACVRAFSVFFATLCVLAFLMGLAMLAMAPVGCTGKSIELYHPQSGKPIAKYHNTTDSEIGGLEAQYNAATGDFEVKVKSSTQSASESNAAMWAAIEKLVGKIPVPVP